MTTATPTTTSTDLTALESAIDRAQGVTSAPLKPSAADVRRIARAAKLAEAAAAEVVCAELFDRAVDALLDARAGVIVTPATTSPTGLAIAEKRATYTRAVELATLVAAGTPGLAARPAKLLTESAVRTIRNTQISRGEWCRQDGQFVRSLDDLRPGTYALGVNGKPRKTTEYVLIATHTTPAGVLLFVEADSSAAVAAPATVAAFDAAWSLIVTAADAHEAAELAQG